MCLLGVQQQNQKEMKRFDTRHIASRKKLEPEPRAPDPVEGPEFPLTCLWSYIVHLMINLIRLPQPRTLLTPTETLLVYFLRAGGPQCLGSHSPCDTVRLLWQQGGTLPDVLKGQKLHSLALSK